MSIGRSTAAGLLDLLAPRACAACELLLREDEVGFCVGCGLLLERAPSAFAPPALSGAAFEYGGPLAAAITALKYRARTERVATLGALLSAAAVPYAGRVDLVIPMPLHPRRLRARGFNQSALLAAPVARTLGVPLCVDRLHRVRDTPNQAGLARAARSENVRGAFACACDGRAQRVLLIDDVRTTGATLAAAAEALMRGGHAAVMTLALARAHL